MINRLKQYNNIYEKDLLFLLLQTLKENFHELNPNVPSMIEFFELEDRSLLYNIIDNPSRIITDIISILFFFHKAYCYIYFENSRIRFMFFSDEEEVKTNLPDCTAKLIIFNFDEIQIFDKNFQQLIKEFPNYSKEMNFEEEIKFHIRMLKLSKKIPFNAYTYCDEYITKAYFRYNEIQFLEHKAKIVQYILDKLNEGIKNLIGSDDIKIHGNFTVEEITKKKNEILYQE